MFSSIVALAFKIFPLYVNIVLGFFASKKLHVARDAIAPLIVYILAPVVVFKATYQVEINMSVLLLPWMLFFIAIAVCMIVFVVTKNFWNDNTRNLAAFSAGTGNTGYFGIPLAFMLLSSEGANIYIFALLVSFLYEYTFGFYIIARGSYTLKESLAKIFRLPVIYAFLVGLFLNLTKFEISHNVLDFMDSFKGAYVVLGMMMVGMGLSSIKFKEIDKKFLSTVLFAKFILWPALALLIIFIDSSFINFFNPEVYDVLIVMSIVPMAANTVTMAILFKTKPEQAALAVLVSTIIAFFTIPIFAALFL